ncbi:hypothetical protein ACFX5D_01390 [Flavobacterium sp. LB3P45]|uniref:Uncharacterized protein n=1 Tax=Flavobacterium fructosi TaxID=3230416 RepID=A0ABW6HIG4_9FLAO
MFDETKITFKEYKEKFYELRVNDFLKKSTDNDEEQFIESELIIFNDCYFSGKVETYQKELLTNEMSAYPYYINRNLLRENLNIKVYNDVVSFHQGFHKIIIFDSEKSKQFTRTFSKIIEFLENKKTAEIKNPFPAIFIGNDNRAFNVFNDFSNDITDPYRDYSFIFQKMKSETENLIKSKCSHKEFINWLFENKYIKKFIYDDFIVKESFSTKYDRGMRPTRYYTIKKRHFPIDSD